MQMPPSMQSGSGGIYDHMQPSVNINGVNMSPKTDQQQNQMMQSQHMNQLPPQNQFLQSRNTSSVSLFCHFMFQCSCFFSPNTQSNLRCESVMNSLIRCKCIKHSPFPWKFVHFQSNYKQLYGTFHSNFMILSQLMKNFSESTRFSWFAKFTFIHFSFCVVRCRVNSISIASPFLARIKSKHTNKAPNFFYISSAHNSQMRGIMLFYITFSILCLHTSLAVHGELIAIELNLFA